MANIWDVRVELQGLDHPEGLNFGIDGNLYAGGEGGQIYKIDLTNNKITELANTHGFILGVAMDANDNVYACDSANHCVHKISTDGRVKEFARTISGEERPLNFPNYGLFDETGNYYVTDSAEYWRPTGRLIRVAPDGTARSILGNSLSFPNGIALSADANQLFMIESAAQRVLSIPLEKDGSPGIPTIYIQTPGYVPDGLALDGEGNLYVGCYTPETVFKVSPDRAIEIFLNDPTAEILNRPTNLAFFMSGGKPRLYISNFGSSNISSIGVSLPGQKLRYPSL
jgi:gluconolactonase